MQKCASFSIQKLNIKRIALFFYKNNNSKLNFKLKMGCSSSEPIVNNMYAISYCTLVPVKEKRNIYKINLLAQEEVEKFSERKFFAQAGQSEEKMINFVKNKNFNKKTIFYLYLKNKPEIRNLYQMIELIPYNYKDLHRVVLLNTEEVKGFHNFFIEKKTINLEYSKFVGSIIDLNDQQKNLENVNNINLTQDNIDNEKNNEEEDEENDEIILVNGLINENTIKDIEENYAKKCDKLIMKEISLKNRNIFSKLIDFFLDKDIKKFYISDTNINDISLFNPILELLEKNYNIRQLILNNCSLMDNHLNDLMRAICDKRIRSLNLSKNAITVEGGSLISEFLLVNKTLQELNISYNDNVNFKAEGIKYIIRSLVDCPNIKLIDFSGMNLTGCGEFIANLLENSKSLEKMVLKNDYLNANDFKNIFEKVKSNKIIKEIDISFNDMGGDKSLEYIRDSIKENTSLIKLNLNKVNINNDNYNIIFEGIEKNKNISFYCLSYNHINPKIVIEFFIKQSHVKNLEFIPYDKNNPEDKNKDFTLDEKKLLEKCKTERPDMNVISI